MYGETYGKPLRKRDRHAFRAGTPLEAVDRAGTGRLDLLRRGERLRQLHRPRLRARDLDVGRVPGGERDLVLAGGTRRHVLVRGGAAHQPDVAVDAIPAQPRTIEDPVMYTRPWKITEITPLLGSGDLIEYVCTENERDSLHLDAIDAIQKSAGKGK